MTSDRPKQVAGDEFRNEMEPIHRAVFRKSAEASDFERVLKHSLLKERQE